MKRTALTIFALGAALAFGAAPAATADTGEAEVAPAVAEALAAVPGGVVIDYWTAEWPSQDMRLELRPAGANGDAAAARSVGTAAVGQCATGRICAFSGYGATGASLSWGSCGTYSTSALGAPVRSIANARSSGTLYARNGTTVVASAAAGTMKNVYATVTNVRC